jgi:hypothetical protein
MSTLRVLLLALAVGLAPGAQAADKPRVLVLTDIENEPDDAMSLVRFLTCANHFDIEVAGGHHLHPPEGAGGPAAHPADRLGLRPGA